MADDKDAEKGRVINLGAAREQAFAESDVVVPIDENRAVTTFRGPLADAARRRLAAELAGNEKEEYVSPDVTADAAAARITLEEGHDSQPQPQPPGKLVFEAAPEDPNNFG